MVYQGSYDAEKLYYLERLGSRLSMFKKVFKKVDKRWWIVKR